MIIGGVIPDPGMPLDCQPITQRYFVAWDDEHGAKRVTYSRHTWTHAAMRPETLEAFRARVDADMEKYPPAQWRPGRKAGR